MHSYYYSSGEAPSRPYLDMSPVAARKTWSTTALVCASVAVGCFMAFICLEASGNSTNTFVTSALRTARVSANMPLYAARRPSGAPAEVPPKSFFDNVFETPKPAAPPASAKRSRPQPLGDVGAVASVGAKVVSELALYLAFNTAYFVTNTYEFLTEEQQKKLAKETVDKQLPELLSLLGGTTETVGQTLKVVAETEEFKELQNSANSATKELTKKVKVEGAAADTLQTLKKIVADEKGEVLSEERKASIAEVLKKGGVKATELSLYVFYNLFTVLRNLDRVLPTSSQTDGIEGKIEELEAKAGSLVQTIKELPSNTGKITEKIEEFKESIPTAEDLSNLDPAEVSLSIRASLASIKTKLDELVDSVSKALAEDSEFRANLKVVQEKLKPVTDQLAVVVGKLPLPKKEDGSVDYSKLLAESGIITVKGLKALIEATKKAAGSVNTKTGSSSATPPDP